MPATKRATEKAMSGLLKVLRGLPKDTDEERTTKLYRQLAEQTLIFREFFLTDKGDPAVTGNNGNYRLEVRDLYTEAGFNADEALVIQRAVRYHISQIQRRTMTPEELEAAGLLPDDQRAKVADRRKAKKAILDAVAATAETEGTEQDKVATLQEVLGTLKNLKPGKRALKAPENVALADAGHHLLLAIIRTAEGLLPAYPAKTK